MGVNFTGYKLVATWPAGETSARLHATLLDSVFTPPLTDKQLAALQLAHRVALLRPGDVFCLSGGVAHATLSLSPNITSYESLVTLNIDNLRLFLKTGRLKGTMPKRELDDLKDRTIDALEAIFEAPEPRSDAAIVLDARLTRRLKRQAAHATRFLVDHDAFYHKYLPSRVLRAARRLLKYS